MRKDPCHASGRLLPGDGSKQNDDDGNYKENMNQTANQMGSQEAQQPENYQYGSKCV
jgi:hypothetical protein